MKRLRNRLALALVLLLVLHIVWPTIAAWAPIVIVLLVLVILYRRVS